MVWYAPWRDDTPRTPLHETTPTPAQTAAVAPRGFVFGVPSGGTTEYNQTGAGVEDRRGMLESLYDSYLACPWSSASVDTIARTIVAGGLEVAFESDDDNGDETVPEPPPGVVKLRALLAFVNHAEDIRQLMRGVISDLEVFGDAFIEVVWLLGEPFALYSLDVPSMRIIADDHGTVTGYVQVTESGQRATFDEDEVIHISLDTPRSGLYGVGPTQKALLPLTTWLYTAATLKEVMRKGDPASIHVDFPAATANEDIQLWRSKYVSQNLGSRNIGVPVTTKGGTTVTEMREKAVENYLKTLDQKRDEILSEYGVPPAKVGVIESGNLGGGTGTSQDKTFRVNTCGPVAAAVIEKLVFALLRGGFGVPDTAGWVMRFGEVDWRDDKTVDDISSARLRDGRWTLNRSRSEIGEPPVDGGDAAVLVDRSQIVAWADILPMSAANLAKAKAPPPTPVAPVAPVVVPAAGPAADDPKGADPDAKETAAAAFAVRFAEARARVRAQIREDTHA